MQWNLYSYCANNPIYYIDSSGHFAYPGEIHQAVINKIVSKYESMNDESKKIWYPGETTPKGAKKFGLCDLIKFKKNKTKAWIWEVKRKNYSYDKAKAQLSKYLNGVHSKYDNATLVAGGSLIKPYRFNVDKEDSEYVVEYWHAGGGIVYYEYKPIVRWKRVAGELLAAVVLKKAEVLVKVPKKLKGIGELVLNAV